MLESLLVDLYHQTRQLDGIIVVDNSSDDSTERMLKISHPRVHYIRLTENQGSAGGYHTGIKAAIQDSDFVWTLDDDVRLRPDSLEKLLEGFHKLEPVYKVGAVRSTGDDHYASDPTKLAIFPWRGTLLKTGVILEMGLPRSEYFLYGEDLEYALRFKKSDYLCFWIPSSKCVERRDEGKKVCKIFSRQVQVYSTPFRLYYAFRNEVAIYKEYRETYSLFKTSLYAVKLTLYFSFYRNGEWLKQVQAIFVGIKDGFIGSLGINRRYQPTSIFMHSNKC